MNNKGLDKRDKRDAWIIAGILVVIVAYLIFSFSQ